LRRRRLETETARCVLCASVPRVKRDPRASSAVPARGLGVHGVTPNVVALGSVSLLTDVSSEMIIPVLPLFVTVTLGASVARLGVIEGVAECTATVLRIGSGWLADRTGSRKPLLVAGYGLSAVAKAGLALASSWPAVLALRFGDRVGKGIRNPPRDAIIADSVEPASLGRAFGLHRGMDTLGAAIGPLVAFLMLGAFPGDYRRIFAWSLVPALLSVSIVILFVRARRGVGPHAATVPLSFTALGGPFRRFIAVAGLFSLANSSTAFLLLLAGRAGLDERQVPLVYLLYNLVYATLSWPVGALTDRVGRRSVLRAAYALFGIVYGLLAWRATATVVLVGFVLLGLHSALLEGTQRSMIADLVPIARRATAFGVYYAVVGLMLLPASIIAGVLWDRLGPRAMLSFDALLALAAATLFAVLLPPGREHQERHVVVA
jgi:MFS family permease